MIEKRRWCKQAEIGLQVSAGADMEIIRGQVKSGQAELWWCESAENACWVVTRIDQEDGELVIVCGEGSGLDEFAPVFVESARRQGLGVRTHVTRLGLLRMWKRHGLELSEFVLRG